MGIKVIQKSKGNNTTQIGITTNISSSDSSGINVIQTNNNGNIQQFVSVGGSDGGITVAQNCGEISINKDGITIDGKKVVDKRVGETKEDKDKEIKSKGARKKDSIKLGVHYRSPMSEYEEKTGKKLSDMVKEAILKVIKD